MDSLRRKDGHILENTEKWVLVMQGGQIRLDRKEDLVKWERCSQLCQMPHSDFSIEIDGQSVAFNSNEKTLGPELHLL